MICVIFNYGNKCLSFIGRRHVMDLWRSKGGKDQGWMPWLTPAWRTELTTDVWEDVSTLSYYQRVHILLFIRAVDYDFQLFHGYISRSIYYFYQQVCTYSEHHELEVCGVWLTDGCICNAWLYWSEFDIQMSLASVFVFRNVFFLDVGFYISVSVHILLPFR